jgi:hypothetical protein
MRNVTPKMMPSALLSTMPNAHVSNAHVSKPSRDASPNRRHVSKPSRDRKGAIRRHSMRSKA